jgi:hypothetical protein
MDSQTKSYAERKTVREMAMKTVRQAEKVVYTGEQLDCQTNGHIR